MGSNGKPATPGPGNPIPRMLPNMTPFADYVSLASLGRHSLRSILVGFVLIIALWMAGSFAAILAGGFFAAWLKGEAGFSYEAAFSGHIGAFVLLGSIALLWPAVRIALHLVHRRHLVTVLGSNLRIDRSDFWRGTAASLLVGLIGTLAWLVAGEDYARTGTTPLQWLVWFAPLAVMVLLQSSAEELLFRGYLVQLLARRFRSPFVWAALPSIGFALLHWYPDATLAMNVAILITIGAFALSAVFLVVQTGNLGAAIGLHWGNNIIALLLFAPDDELEPIALFSTTSLSDPSWTTRDAVNLAAVGIFFSLATVWLLVHPRSPLRLSAFNARGGS